MARGFVGGELSKALSRTRRTALVGLFATVLGGAMGGGAHAGILETEGAIPRISAAASLSSEESRTRGAQDLGTDSGGQIRFGAGWSRVRLTGLEDACAAITIRRDTSRRLTSGRFHAGGAIDFAFYRPVAWGTDMALCLGLVGGGASRWQVTGDQDKRKLTEDAKDLKLHHMRAFARAGVGLGATLQPLDNTTVLVAYEVSFRSGTRAGLEDRLEYIEEGGRITVQARTRHVESFFTGRVVRSDAFGSEGLAETTWSGRLLVIPKEFLGGDMGFQARWSRSSGIGKTMSFKEQAVGIGVAVVFGRHSGPADTPHRSSH